MKTWIIVVALAVSPVCAGMNHRLLAVQSGSACIPRVRGDEPLQFALETLQQKYPPCARG